MDTKAMSLDFKLRHYPRWYAIDAEKLTVLP
jgi:hypothetical protein